MYTSRRMFLNGLISSALVSQSAFPVRAQEAPALFTKKPEDFDPKRIVFLSDTHCNPKGNSYQRQHFQAVVAEILKMTPLPARVVIFGDFAYLNGGREDYAAASQTVKPLTDAGIKLTIGMGNHDRRDPFLEFYPGYAKTSPVPGRIVSVVETQHLDLIMLDSLQHEPSGKGIVGGAIDPEQRKWLALTLKEYKKPVFICAHHEIKELKLDKLLVNTPQVAGFIHGHHHRWRKGWVASSWSSPKTLRTLCLPSTGHWGDIGYTLFRTRPDRAVAELRQSDFYFPHPLPQEKRPAEWDVHVEENRGQTCTFLLPKMATA